MLQGGPSEALYIQREGQRKNGACELRWDVEGHVEGATVFKKQSGSDQSMILRASSGYIPGVPAVAVNVELARIMTMKLGARRQQKKSPRLAGAIPRRLTSRC